MPLSTALLGGERPQYGFAAPKAAATQLLSGGDVEGVLVRHPLDSIDLATRRAIERAWDRLANFRSSSQRPEAKDDYFTCRAQLRAFGAALSE